MLVVSAATALIASTFTTTAAQAAIPNSPKKSAQKQAVTPEKKPASAVPLKDRDTVLGKGWKTSADRAVTAVADSDGLHLMVADSRNGYSWKTAAVLSEPQLPADTWIGNQCVMDDHHAAVVYAPRTFANKPDLMMGGGFAAIVNLDDGSVTKLPFTASLAYFDPTCSPATHTAVFTALRDTKTRLITVNIKGATVADTTAKGEITSAVPTRDGVIAAAGNRLVHVDRKGRTAQLAATKHAPYGIRVSGDGTVSYIDRTGDTDANVQTYAHGRKTTVASGRLTAMNLRQGTDGTVYLTGSASHGKSFAASGIKQLNVSPDAELSTRGRLAVDPVVSPAVQAGVDNVANAGRDFTKASTKEPAAEKTTGHTDHALTVTGTVAGTGRHTKQQTAEPDTTAGGTPSPALTGSSKPQLSTMSMLTTAGDDARAHDPVDTDAWCSVPRNDVKSQALQPTPNQVEWAVDMAVRNDLRSSYLTQGGWRSQTGLATIDPQGMFPDPPLNTGSGQRIPAQVELGILAQESNLWQAESGAIPGQMGSPLAAVDGYYGHQSGGSLADFWVIHWDKSDCGYGVGQVTDGMRKAGHEKPGEKSKDVTTQRAIALDYATNIAASLYILADKWNEVHQSGQTITVNNDDPSKPENWFTAVWNYNLGFNKKADAGTNGNWGLGWYNNPANPVYPASRLAFLNTDLDPLAAKDAAHPQNWPYEEKVMGWAAWSQDTGHSYATSGRQDWPGESGFSSAGFYPASWNGTAGTVIDPASGKYRRAHVSPPLDAFCNTKNNCNTANPPNCPTAACYAQYWWHESNVTWKSDCATSCGNEHIKYLTLVSEPGRGYRLQYGTPVCTGAPSGAQVVESVPAGTDTWGGCGTTTTDGSFQFTFYADPKATGPGLGQYDAKADLHQIGGGYGGHFWYTHTRNEDYLGGKTSGSMTIRGTWTPSRTLDLAEVYVHVPDTGAQAQQAHYEISGAVGGPYDRYVDQDGNNKWVSLGAFKFDGTPSVSLSNYTPTGSADDDIAFGAVAFQPVQGTFVHRTLTAASVFDPNQELNSNWPVSELNTPIRAMKDLYNWATELSYGTDGGPLWDGSPSNVVTASGLTSWPKCTTEANKDECVGPQTYNAGEQWYQDIKAGGYTVKADGSVPTMSIPKWMGMSNVRPNPSASPDQAFKDPNSYKIKSDVSVTFVKDDTGHIISGSQSASYDVRVGNAHLPVFVTQLIKAISSDYGIATPDLTYTTPDALEYGRTYTADPLQDGDTPGQAYFPHFRGARLNSDNTCVDFRAVGGGVHGYRAMIGHTSVNDNVKAWVDKVDNSSDTNFSVRRVAEDIYSMFFKNSGDWNNNMWGTMIGNAPPIWHDIAAAFCADGSVKPTHKEGNGDADPSNGLVWQSYMPDLYVYIDGTMTDDLGRPSSTRVHAGDWKDFSNFPVTAPNGNAFGSCDASGRGSGGNPWGVDPPVPLFGDGPGNRPSKVLHCDDPGTEFQTNLTP